MSFSNIIQKYFSNLFISIVSEDNAYRVFSKVIKNSKLVKKFDKTFDIKIDSEKLDSEVEDYLISLQEKYNFTYITLLLDSMGQGAICGTEVKDFEKFSVDVKNVKSIKFKNWVAHASFIDINWINKIYSNVGVDFIYSPFVVLHHLLSQYKLKTKSTLYMLNQKDSITLCVFKEGTLCFGVYLKIANEESLDSSNSVEDWESEEEANGVENLVTPHHDAHDDENNEEELSNLEDLTSFDTQDDELDRETFLDTNDEQNPDMLKGDESEDVSVEDIELYGRDIDIYKFLNRALREYYKNPIYESDFIDQMIIFDGYDMSEEIIQSVKDELFLDLQMHKIDVSEIVCDLSIKEVNHEL